VRSARRLQADPAVTIGGTSATFDTVTEFERASGVRTVFGFKRASRSTPVGTGGQYEMTRVDLQRLNPVGSCTNGRHTASSGGAFTIMVWGLANFASYAYPAGGNVGKINPVVVIGRQQ
jgi:hypothetical protein